MDAIEIPDFRLDESLDYNTYRNTIKDLLKEGKTTGPNQSEKYIGYTTLNDQRMNRLDKTIKLSQETVDTINSIKRPQTWLVLTEAWCGDAAQNIPVIQKMAELNPNINVQLHWRDENLDIMDAFLTNGARSIPKLIVLDEESLEVVGGWGPRPAELQEMMMAQKENPTMTKEEFSVEVQKWYNKNKGVAVQQEILNIFR